MERDEVLETFFEEVKKLPARQEICELSEDTIRSIVRRFNFKKVGGYVFRKDLELEEEEIPTEISWNQIYLYLVLLKEKLAVSFEYYEISTEDSFVERVEKIQEAFGFNKSYGEFVTTLPQFFEYMKSDKPDF